MQMAIMFLAVGEDIGTEKHEGVTQFILIERGKAELQYKTPKGKLIQFEGENGSVMFFPSGIWHNVINIDELLKLYTIYSPSNHPVDTIQKYKQSDQYQLI